MLAVTHPGITIKAMSRVLYVENGRRGIARIL